MVPGSNPANRLSYSKSWKPRLSPGCALFPLLLRHDFGVTAKTGSGLSATGPDYLFWEDMGWRRVVKATLLCRPRVDRQRAKFVFDTSSSKRRPVPPAATIELEI